MNYTISRQSYKKILYCVYKYTINLVFIYYICFGITKNSFPKLFLPEKINQEFFFDSDFKSFYYLYGF